MKSCLLQFPSTSKYDSLSLTSYNTYVEREMGLTISLVKVVQSKPENIVENYLVLMPETAHNVTQFQRVLDLKVRQEQLCVGGAVRMVAECELQQSNCQFDSVLEVL